MKEKEKNRAHFLLDCLENNGQITINREDMLNILKLNREITIDEFVKSLFANDVIDKSVVRRVAEQMKGDKE